MPEITEAVAALRASADDPRLVEGIAVPYGVVARNTEIGPETFAPGAFRDSLDTWNAANDGRRIPFRPAHKERPVGSVVAIRDTPEGVLFSARIRPGPRGDDYLADVADGLNGVSVEFDAPTLRAGRPSRSGVTVHRNAVLYGIAGSVTPAYDGARVAARDMEDAPVPEITETPEAPAEREASTEITPAARDAAERSSVAEIRPASITITRPELIYRRDAAPLPDGTSPNFIRDGYLAWKGDTAAADRASRHNAMLADIARQAERAGDVLVAEIPGMYPNDYIPGLLTPRILKGRPMGGYFNRYPIADARPRIFAKVTTSGSVVTAADGVALTATDVATTAVTATPAIYGGYTDISRAALDGGDPSTLAMVQQDLLEGYAQASEAVIVTAVEAGASASGTAIAAATPFAGTLGNVIKYYSTRFRPAGAQFVPSALFAVLLAEADTAGRPKMPNISPNNSSATTADGAVNGTILGSTTFLSWGSTVNVVVTTRPEDYVIYESPVAQFTYEQSVGTPAMVRVGCWAYIAAAARLGGLKVTAA